MYIQPTGSCTKINPTEEDCKGCEYLKYNSMTDAPICMRSAYGDGKPLPKRFVTQDDLFRIMDENGGGVWVDINGYMQKLD